MGVHRAVFLDRDGVITRALVRARRPYAPVREQDFEILPDAAACVRRLRHAGFRLIVVTNQPEVARGSLEPNILERMHTRLKADLAVDDIRTCVHDENDGCGCRKPAPGLLIDAAADHDVSLPASFMIGDRWRDIEAEQRAGCTTIFLDHDYDERQPDRPDVVVRSLDEAANWILSRPPQHT